MSTETKKTEVRNCLETLAQIEGYELRKRTGLFQLGSDIKASKDNENWYIELIGSEGSGLEMVNDFYSVFFRAISRLNNSDCDHCIIAIPESLRKFIYIRARIYKVAWERIAKNFPELEIWIIDVDSKTYQRTSL